MKQVTRCGWAQTPLGIAYHDTEWGVPVHDDRILFEFLILEGAQAGLSWETILKKREGYREAFANFDPERIARFTPADAWSACSKTGNRPQPPQGGEHGDRTRRRSSPSSSSSELRRLHVAAPRRSPRTTLEDAAEVPASTPDSDP